MEVEPLLSSGEDVGPGGSVTARLEQRNEGNVRSRGSSSSISSSSTRLTRLKKFYSRSTNGLPFVSTRVHAYCTAQ